MVCVCGCSWVLYLFGFGGRLSPVACVLCSVCSGAVFRFVFVLVLGHGCFTINPPSTHFRIVRCRSDHVGLHWFLPVVMVCVGGRVSVFGFSCCFACFGG